MTKLSAGFLMFRRPDRNVEVLLVHPGGPFWAKKDLASWSLPKGEYDEGEDPFAAAVREFEEETGMRPNGEFIPLGQIRQPSGKLVTAWAFESDCDCSSIRSNMFSMEWPKGSRRMQEFPEIDKGEWFTFDVARRKILKGQVGFLEKLAQHLGCQMASQASAGNSEEGETESQGSLF
jgi:predicted NUDIX family NTP pyrophosphohydrolase